MYITKHKPYQNKRSELAEERSAGRILQLFADVFQLLTSCLLYVNTSGESYEYKFALMPNLHPQPHAQSLSKQTQWAWGQTHESEVDSHGRVSRRRAAWASHHTRTGSVTLEAVTDASVHTGGSPQRISEGGPESITKSKILQKLSPFRPPLSKTRPFYHRNVTIIPVFVDSESLPSGKKWTRNTTRGGWQTGRKNPMWPWDGGGR